MKKIILFATFLYLLLSTLTYHPDNKLVLNWASVNNGTVWNIWEVNTREAIGVGQFNYPPLHYYLDKLQYFIAKPLGGSGFYEWLSSANSTDQNQSNLSRYSFAIKFPLIIFAFFAAYLLYLIAKQNKATEKQSVLIAGLWLFNPITIYSIPVMGQNDVMAIVFFLAGWLLLNKNKLIYSSVLFGLGASVKMFPLLWLPFILLVDQSFRMKQKMTVFFGSFFIYILTLLPFITNPVFRENVFYQGIERMFVARIDLGFDDYILVVPILLMFIVYGALKKYQHIHSKQVIVQQATIVLHIKAIVLFFNHFHPQWFLWLVPFWAFWILSLQKTQQHFALFSSCVVLFSWLVVIFLFNDSALTFGLLTPLNPYLSTLPTLRSVLLLRKIDVLLYNNYAHTLLAGIGVIFFISWYKNQANTERELNPVITLPKIGQNKIFTFLGILVTSAIMSFLLVFFANLIPAPITGPSPTIVNYPYFLEPVEKSFIAEFNGLNRIDLKLSDVNLRNTDDFLITIFDESKTEILHQKFSGRNVGFESSLRFNFPIQFNSMGKEYFVKIYPQPNSVEPIKIATTVENDPQEFAFQVFYEKPQGKEFIQFVFSQTLTRSLSLIIQNTLLLIILPITLWFAL